MSVGPWIVSLFQIEVLNRKVPLYLVSPSIYLHCRKGKTGAVFRGRISVNGLEIEDIPDGSGTYVVGWTKLSSTQSN